MESKAFNQKQQSKKKEGNQLILLARHISNQTKNTKIGTKEKTHTAHKIASRNRKTFIVQCSNKINNKAIRST
jgi:hypothetical protein